MTDLQKEVLADLEDSQNAESFEEREGAFYSFVAGVGELGRRGELDELGTVAVDDFWLNSLISKLASQLVFHSGDDLYLGRTLEQRSDVQFVLDIATGVPRNTILFADWWDEKIIYAWREDGVNRVPEGIPGHHWWWFPEFRRTTISGSFTTLALPPGETCSAVRSLSNALHFDSRATLEVLVRNRFHEVAPAERLVGAGPGDVCLQRLRKAVERGECTVVERGSRLDCIFADGRLEATVNIDKDGVSLGWFEPRARVVIDEQVPSLIESLELLRQALEQLDPYPPRRLLVTEFFDRLGSICRFRPRDEVFADAEELRTVIAPYILFLGGWSEQCERRLLGDQPSGAEQPREDRTVAQFLYDLVGDDEDLRSGLDTSIDLESWDRDLRKVVKDAKRCPIPPNTPESHWWWREGVS